MVSLAGRRVEGCEADVMAELGMTEGFDVGLEMSGAPPALFALCWTP